MSNKLFLLLISMKLSRSCSVPQSHPSTSPAAAWDQGRT